MLWSDYAPYDWSGQELRQLSVCRPPPGQPRKGKVFFFEKKKQKTFIRLASASPERLGFISKSFLVLFFKKELLASFTRRGCYAPGVAAC
jgi:hypothetical protein